MGVSLYEGVYSINLEQFQILVDYWILSQV